MKKRLTKTLIASLSVLLPIFNSVVAQDCDPEVPTFFVDLSSDASMVYSSPAEVRNGNCCGTVHPAECIAFDILLHEDAVGINFDICGGAVPPGALFYQIDCGPEVAVGEVICLDGPGPHHLTFCKPGNNQNVYCIESIPPPSASPTQIASDGCDAEIWCEGYDIITINWTSVFPGPVGTYDDYIACTTCETTTVSAPEDFPPYADFMICGETIAGCATTPDCDTVRVYFESSLAVGVLPEVPVICYGAEGTEVTAIGAGGFPPYTFTWSNGTSGVSTWIEEPGTYTVTLTDTSDCPPASFEFTVTEYELPLTVNAGSDIVLCSNEDNVQLNGSFTGIDSCQWEGGNGTFIPHRYDPNAIYIPTPAEIESGQLELILALYPAGDCEPASDTLLVQFAVFNAVVDSNVQNVQCFGANDGSISVNVAGDWSPYTIDWSTPGLTDWNLSALPPATYTAIISNAVGCSIEVEFEIQEPQELTTQVDQLIPVSCAGANDGAVNIIVSGGLPEYSFMWPNNESDSGFAENLSPGEYTVVVQDTNACSDSITFTIEEPTPLSITAASDTLVCPGEQFTVTAESMGGNGIYTYHWSHGLPDAPSATLQLQESDTVSVFVTDQNGCTSETILLPVEVITMDPDLLEVTPGNPVCQGGSSSVAAFYAGEHPPYTYSWNNGVPDGPGPHTVSPGETAVYTVTVSDVCGNEVIGDMEIVIYPLPELGLSEINDVQCFGMDNGSATLTVSGGTPDFVFTWSDEIDHGSAADNLAPGNYTVQLSDQNQCSDNIGFAIEEPAPLSITATSDTLVCPDEQFIVSAEASGGIGNYTYHWSHGLPDAPSETLQLQESDTISVFVTDQNGCTSETILLPVEVITMDPDLLEVTPGNPVCQGGSSSVAAFYAGEHPPYTYSWNNGVPDGPGPHTVSPGETAVYTVTVSDVCGNEVIGDMEIVIYPLPELGLSEINDVQCFGLDNGSATLTVSGGTPDFTFTWSDGIDHGAAAENLAPGNYIVELSDSFGCPDSTSFSIGEPDPLTFTAGSGATICPGDEVTIWAEASGGVGSYNYHWNQNLPDAGSHQVSPENDTEYVVSISDGNDCQTNETNILIDVIVFEPPLLNAVSDGNICYGESTSVVALYEGTDPPYTYAWSNGLPDGPGPHIVQPSDSMTYTVTVTDICENTISEDVSVAVWPLPEISMPDILGDGCSPVQVNFSDTLNDSDHHTYVWTVDDNYFYTGPNFSLSFDEPGTHTVDLTVTSFNGCQSSSESPSLVIVLPSPDAQFTADPWVTGIDVPEINFTNLSTGQITNWIWDFGDGEFSNALNPNHLYSDTGTYAVQLFVENEFGCTDDIIQSVVVYPVYNIIIPNAFTPTPGNDGYYDPSNTNNDIFYPFADYVEEFRMSIYNRWGELIFESLEHGYGWNGEYRGELCAQDVYVYKIEFKFSDGVEITRVGDITLFR